MLKRFIFILILLTAFSLSACAQQPKDSCNKYSEPSLGVLFCAPSNWTITKESGETYQRVIGGNKNGIAPIINIMSGNFDLTLPELVTQMKDYTMTTLYKEKGYSSINFEGQSEFQAKTQRGYKIVYIPESNGNKLRVTQYLFAGKGKVKIVVTASSVYSDKEVMDKIFDDAMKTFEVSQ